ncbi:alpha/beta-hydrolase [Serendipita vermifera]|nr:alpha/beta-hydrolase [Serendipita vermifera]
MHFPIAPVLALWLALASSCSSQSVPTIKTTSGKLQGVALNGTNAYLGVPFATPPTGHLRFLAPRSLNTPNTARNATIFGPACIQLPLGIPFPSPSGESEDCLTLNVWASSDNSSRGNKKKPVLIWLYGGGWNTGSAGTPLNDLTSWASAHPEIIFVSPNYRPNLFGHPNTPAISRGDTNAGLRDQRLAIEWVRDNIAAFGGDPNRLILGGHSAGAGSAAGYLYAHPWDSLISGAILMSGQAPLGTGSIPNLTIPGIPNSQPNPFPAIASAVGCSLQGNNYARQLECVQQKNTTELVNALTTQNVLGFGPFVDNQTAFSVAEYKSRGRAGKFAKVPILTGTTDNEGDIFVLDRATNTLNQTVSDYVTLELFRCYDSWQSSFSVSAGVPTYRYRSLGQFPTITAPPLRAWHMSDMIVLFGTLTSAAPPGAAPTTEESAAIAYMEKAWSAFIADPANGLKSLGWPLYKGPNRGATLLDIFPDNDVQNPIRFEDPKQFDSGCAALGLGL